MTDYVGKWDCPYCDTDGIDGYIYDCPGCGRPRSRGVKFYLPDNPAIATPEQMKLMGNDPNWYCEHCDSGNKDSNTHCWNCGAERGSSPSHQTSTYVGDTVPHSEDEVPEIPKVPEAPKVYTPHYDQNDNGYNSALKPHLDSMRQTISDMRVTTKATKYAVIGASALLVILLSLLVYQFFFNTHQVSAYIDGFSWSRNVVIQEYKTLHEQGWTVPGEGRTTGSERRQNGTVRISDGYTTESYSATCYRSETQMGTCSRSVYHSRTCTRDNGNGSFSTYDCGSSSMESYSCPKTVSVPYSCTRTRQKELYHYEPTYGTWYFYDIDRWVTIGNQPTSAKDHKPFYDPKPKTTDDLHRRVEQPGTYTTYFSCEETGDFERNYSLIDWKDQKIGDEYKVTTNYWKVVLNVEK